MPSNTLFFDIRAAQAEAVFRIVRDWQPTVDVAASASLVEALVKEGLDSPRRLRELANDVFDNIPRDGSGLDYLNRQYKILSACFDFTIDALRTTCELARESVNAGYQIPSLPALEQAIQKAEQVRTDTFEHWEIFDEQPDLGPPEEWLTTEEVFKDREAQLSEEARRELQSRLDEIRR
jgi:hypothetical protein